MEITCNVNNAYLNKPGVNLYPATNNYLTDLLKWEIE